MEVREGIIGKVGGIARRIGKGLDTRVEKVLLEEIDDSAVAKTIITYLGNPARERLGQDRWANPFSIVDVMANIGYVAAWNDQDYMQRYPEEYRRVRQVLHRLSSFRALELIPQEEADSQKESIYYKVTDELKLRDIAEGLIDKKAKSA